MALLNETQSTLKTRRNRGWLRRLVKIPPLSWWLRDPVEKESFLLVAAYFLRDRETKLRLYPSLAQVIVLPVFFLFGFGRNGEGGWEIALAGMYLGYIPLTVLQMLEYSEHWRASEIFRFTPNGRWQPLFHGARKATLALLAFPSLLVLAGIVLAFKPFDSKLLLLLPSVVILPLWSLVPGIMETWLPLSKPFDVASRAYRGCMTMAVVMTVSGILSALAWFSLDYGVLPWFLLAVAIAGAGVFAALRAGMQRREMVAGE